MIDDSKQEAEPTQVSGPAVAPQPLLIRLYPVAKEALELAPRVAIAAASACYLVGFIIVNVHLAHCGVFDLGLVQARYITAGVLWFFLTASTFLFWATLGTRWKEAWASRRETGEFLAKLVALVFVAGWIGLLYGFTLDFASGHRVRALSPSRFLDTLPILLILAANAVQFLVAVDLVRYFLGLPLRRIDFLVSWPEKTGQLFGILAVVAYFTSSLTTYALAVYPKFEPTFGGGAHLAVRIAPTASLLPVLAPLGIKPDSDGLVGPLELVADIGDTAVLIPPGADDLRPTTSIRLRHSDLLAVLSFGSEVGGPIDSSISLTPSAVPSQTASPTAPVSATPTVTDPPTASPTESRPPSTAAAGDAQ